MNQKIRIKLRSYDHNLVDKSTEKIVKDGKKQRRCGNWSDSAAHREKDLYRAPFSARQ
jgi:ribosomal protein S10